MRLLLPLLLLSVSGCIHYMPAAVSSTSLGDRYQKPVRVVEGRSSAYYILGFIGPMGNDSLVAAVEDAKSEAPSDTMVNVFVDRQVFNFPFDYLALFTRIQTTVYGTLVKYQDEAGDSLPKASLKPESGDWSNADSATGSLKPKIGYLPKDIAPGDKVMVEKTDGTRFKGEFLGADVQGRVLFRLSAGGARLPIPLESIHSVTRQQPGTGVF